MRIISGKNKGKKLIHPIDRNTRPLRDMPKEAIFNLIENSNKYNVNILNGDLLDLFSGSGSFGLECISRGAKNVKFMENYAPALKILEKNIININAVTKCRIIKQNCFNFFEKENNYLPKFDIIFLDPPFKEQKINQLIEKIKNKKILKINGILILHRHKKDDLQITNKLNIIDARNYGISKIIIGN